MRRGPLVLLPAIPILALLSAVWLPFVNTRSLWLGMPRLFVWCSVWVMLITPTLFVVDRDRRRRLSLATTDIGTGAASTGTASTETRSAAEPRR
ncbi:hypothetical protein [Embleya sp. NBC_00896]|uniref:hypothetical protein n=1 Tax=Embleya sp. NBC_00896 TaxID=2975961 RepID=UPI00386525ED|nr:hypothetical protein OG928_10190 [Embleya sp. NBC_00896]